MHDKARETEQCEEVFQAAAKKFRHSRKVTRLPVRVGAFDSSRTLDLLCCCNGERS